jgi:uncharacterized protein (DUF2147 family)
MMTPLKTAVSLAIAAIVSVASFPARSQDLTPIGVWLHQDKRFEVQIGPCGNQLCGKIIWLKSPDDATGHPRVDEKNPDPSLRSQPLLGMTVLHVPMSGDQHTLKDGTIYNPDDGSAYSAIVSVADDGTLRIHAYVLAPFLGKTVVFTRAS